VDDLFAPPDTAWQRVSPALARMRRTVLAVVVGLLLLLNVVIWLIVGVPTGLVVALVIVLLLFFLLIWFLIGRSVRRWGYAERGEDLYITRGHLFRRLVVVPYGRMQYVDVQAGPLDRAFGIAQIHLHTASPGTSARIPGLPAA
jgi:uncharacterized protein